MKNARDRLTYQHGWIAMLVVGLTFEVLAPKGHTLSEGYDVFLEEHPVGGRVAVALVGFHLANVFSDLDIEHLDLVHQIAKALGK